LRTDGHLSSDSLYERSISNLGEREAEL
jgi:hypothetical protein